MAEGQIYRIYVHRRNDSTLIDDEDIWVGNIPNDGHSKITNGRMAQGLAYVQFESWSDLLKALGDRT